jgi:Flp pilus assembly pilin Flp
MNIKCSKLSTAMARIVADMRGAFMIEFALILPMVITVILLAVELGNYVITHNKLSEISFRTADNIARVRVQIDERDINDVLTGSLIMGENIAFADHGRIVISAVQVNPAGDGQWLRWQRCVGNRVSFTSQIGEEGDGEKDKSLKDIGAAGQKLTATGSGQIIVAETEFDYQPIFGAASRTLFNLGSDDSPILINYQNAATVRERLPQPATDSSGNKLSDLKNQSSIADSDLSLCE